jgi:hypothetical protein
MIITEEDINRFAENPGSRKNGRDLADGGKFFELEKNEDETLIWGKCAGSGAKPYFCSIDLLDKEKLDARCNCPSRQRPCKHSIGLLYAAAKGLAFQTSPAPDALIEAREKGRLKAEKTTKPAKMTKAKAAGEAKKCAFQIEGVELGEKMLHNIALSGFAAVGESAETSLKAQIKELGNYYIKEIQAEFKNFLSLLQKDENLIERIEKIVYLRVLLVKGKAYLERKKAYFEAFPNNSPDDEKSFLAADSIEEQLGYAWKLAELREKGLMVMDAELVQAAFWEENDPSREQWIDVGYWLSLKDKRIYVTRDYRPYKIKDSAVPKDSFHQILTASELYRYPCGNKNPRVRWEKSSYRALLAEDYKKAQEFGESDFTSVIKEVKNQIKSPLADKNPVYALKIAEISIDDAENFFIFDEKGAFIPLIRPSYAERFFYLSREQAECKTMIARFMGKFSQQQDGVLYATPLALITDNAVIRFC